jgi:hypothetical protein
VGCTQISIQLNSKPSPQSRSQRGIQQGGKKFSLSCNELTSVIPGKHPNTCPLNNTVNKNSPVDFNGARRGGSQETDWPGGGARDLSAWETAEENSLTILWASKTSLSGGGKRHLKHEGIPSQPYQPKHHQSQKQLLPIKFSQQILNQTLTINLLESQLLNFLSTALSYCHRGFALPQNVKSILRFLSTDGTTRLRDYLLVEKIRFCWEEVISHFPQKNF